MQDVENAQAMAGLDTNAWPTLRDYVKTAQTTIGETFKSEANGAKYYQIVSRDFRPRG